MSYQFLKTAFIQGHEYAYLLDSTNGVVVRTPVMDHPQSHFVPHEEEEDIAPLPYVPRRPMRVPQPVDPSQPENFEEEAPPPPQAPRRPKSLVPPHLRGVFIKPGKPGADTEHREV